MLKSEEYSYEYNTKYYQESRSHLPRNRHWEYTIYGRQLKNDIKCAFKDPNYKHNAEDNACTSMQAEKKIPFQFKIASYNILAPSLLDQNFYLYKDINHTYTDWNYRRSKIYYEIKQFNADIYCFQEMQENQYYEYFLPRFKRLGYKCYYMKRYGDQKQDGCCIIFKSKKFRLDKIEYINFFVSNIPVLNRENVGIVMLLEPKQDSLDGKKICVATTHILYNPKRGDCKLAQVQYFLSHIEAMAFNCIKKINNKLVQAYYPIILCGDFNCDFRSHLYEFISNGKLNDYKNINRNLLSGQLEYTSSYIPIENNLLPLGIELNISDQCQFKHEVLKRLNSLDEKELDGCEQPNLNHGGVELKHSFNFESVYTHYTSEMALEVTTCLKDTKKTVDYMFFHNSNLELAEEEDDKCGKLELVGRLELFKMHQVEHLISLPIKNYPSDHFMIAAKFVLS